jgi:hypothetical protein
MINSKENNIGGGHMTSKLSPSREATLSYGHVFIAEDVA